MRAATILCLAIISAWVLSCASATSKPSAPRSLSHRTPDEPQAPASGDDHVAKADKPSETPHDQDWYDAQYGGCAQVASPSAGGAQLTATQGAAIEPLFRGSTAPDGTGEGTLGIGPLGKGVRGSLSKEHIRAVIRAGLGEVRGCYDRALEVWPSAAGRVVVTFLIAPNGTVTRAEVTQNQTNVTEIGCCIASKVRSWVFSKPEGGGIVIVSYPFVLEPVTTPPP